jgi:polyhydroxybutyrate depolymerase
MRYRLLYLLILFLLVLSVSAQESVKETITHNERDRQFWVNLPPERDEPSGLIIMLHGAQQSGAEFHHTFPVTEGANEFNYITVFPNSVRLRWNILTHSGSTADDLDFIRVLIETMQERHNIDENRIFITGYSNGGMMALSAGCALSDVLAGVVILAATYAPPMLERCLHVAAPYPQMMLLSTTDGAFPWNGDGNILSVEDAITFEFFRFNCNPGNLDVAMISTDESSIAVHKLRSQECDGRGELTFYRVDEVPHYPLPLNMEVTLDNGDIGDMQDLFWQFIVNHTKDAEELPDT